MTHPDSRPTPPPGAATATPSRLAVFSLGSNQGDCQALLQGAVDQLAATPGLELVALSGVHLTAPVGPVTDQPEFHNLVLVGRTGLDPEVLLERCHQVEAAAGRVRTRVGGPRTLDVDLVMVGQERRHGAELTLPHPRAHERAFVLVPWLEADPAAVLPGHGPVADLLAGLDRSGVRPADDLVRLP